MKNISTILIAVLLFGAAFKFADHVVMRLGLRHAVAQQYILNNLVGDFGTSHEDHGGQSGKAQTMVFQIPRVSLSAVKGPDQTTAVKEMCLYVKSYVNSQEFLDAYKAKREQAKPTEEPFRPSDAQIAEMKKNLKELEAQKALLKKTPGVTKEMMVEYDASIVKMKQAVAGYGGDPTPNKTRWEKMYPADPAIMVKRRLQEYLSLAATVDFDAELVSKSYKKVFVKPAYEQQSPQWKAIFRAGKSANQEVIAFVNEWMKGDIIGAKKTDMKAFAN